MRKKVRTEHNPTFLLDEFKICFSFITGDGNRTGKIMQRFPEKDWPDTPFIEGIEWVG